MYVMIKLVAKICFLFPYTSSKTLLLKVIYFPTLQYLYLLVKDNIDCYNYSLQSLTKGLTIFGETVASSLTGVKPVSPGKAGVNNLVPGIVTIIDIHNVDGEVSVFCKLFLVVKLYTLT